VILYASRKLETPLRARAKIVRLRIKSDLMSAPPADCTRGFNYTPTIMRKKGVPEDGR